MPLPANRPALQVDLAALGRNLETLRELSGPAEVAPVVKADAYGLGAEEVCRHLAEHHGVASFFVAYAVEARPVRHAVNRPGIGRCDLYVLNGFQEADATRFDLLSLRPVLNTQAECAAWAQRGGPCAVAVDLGMNRLGLAPSELGGLAARTGLDRDDVKLVCGHYSHAGTPGAPQTARQADAFARLAAAAAPAFPKARFSLSNSGGVLSPHQGAERLVRPGVALYGGAPDGDPESALEAVATLTAPVLGVRTVEAGGTVGYDGTWAAPGARRVATLAMGYADGYLRALSGRGLAWIGGAVCPVVGRVSMDLVAVDVTEAGEVAPGDRAELFGLHLPIDRIARLADTIAYELLAAMGPRVERRYAW